ncbi:hypothetical protein LAUMK4_04661 [Mycobacterium persicum]|uniref:Uncharacterized protein n=1 Tax=Mycobacterium persicum TaxID=1487726 RepID=A0AB38UYC1_9MYCO|nr:hypothetical protein LAUMK15_04969 [Mycobacterium persicum]VAZ85804.1 hypothetical protein LAUMK42_04642 [Mycobacterium persicum]VAZ99596.1 hypothetical protein LAUMK4_04661 [Mycobacterium persicum]
MLYVTECSWASELVGAGLDFATVSGFSETEAVSLPRGLQRKIGRVTTAELLFPGSGRLSPADGGWRRAPSRSLGLICGVMLGRGDGAQPSGASSC